MNFYGSFIFWKIQDGGIKKRRRHFRLKVVQNFSKFNEQTRTITTEFETVVKAVQSEIANTSAKVSFLQLLVTFKHRQLEITKGIHEHVSSGSHSNGSTHLFY